MASEEMEISTDLGFHALTEEDIDIDVEFAAQDEDLELGDFNQTEDFQHFNSDNRDELMAENDDASYGMIDVDDMSYNETAAAANDYEIPIGDADVYSWQEADATGVQEDEIFAEDIPDGDAPDFQTGGENITTTIDNDETSAPAQVSASDIAPQDVASGVEHYEVTEAVDNDEAAAAMDADAEGIAEQDFEDTDESAAQDRAAEEPATGPAAEELESSVPSPPMIESNDESGGKQSIDIDNNAGIQQTDLEPQAAEYEDHHDDPQDDEDEIGYEQEETDKDVHEEGLAATLNLEQVSNEVSHDQVSIQEVASEEAHPNHDDQSAEKNQLNDNSFDEAEDRDDQESKPETSHATPTHNPVDSPAPSEHDGEDGVEAVSEDISQDMKQIASRHAMVVRYGETDYRLFAHETDDDPSEYFFKDLSALQLSMGDFLSELRNVISEEVSPLDELVLHVDGLGLEFGETMTSSILDAYTFGTIVSLYDSLVQNDATEETLDAPELYMYLMVRPNCLQRLMALQVQAASGRSLTDVAVYREASPEQEPDAEEHSGNHAMTPEYAEEELYDHDEQSEDGSFTQDHAGTQETEQESEQATFAAESEETQEQAQHEEEENPDEPEEDSAGNDVDDVVDYDNLDLSPSQQAEADLDETEAPVEGHDTADVATAEENRAPPSESTSATATLDGNLNDEIDYDENDLDNGRGDADNTDDQPAPLSPAKLMVPLDEEITWESENEEARTELPATSNPSEQVSTTPGKRTRSGSDAAVIIDGRKDVKRQRS
ncbi:hypothetical protein E8E14_009057 [Neopestalotiopsis sp. 37M]|nr:hypothetical protein E8E14_009057 [Neopestalotiopsis sp. 37M]